MQTNFYKSITILFCIVFFSLNAFGSEVNQEVESASTKLDLQSLLIYVLKNNEEIKRYSSQVEQAKANYSKSKGLYYPTVDVIADGGWENIEKERGIDTDETRYDARIRAKQLITDFGKTTQSIERAGILLEQAKERLEASRQELMLNGIKAYIGVVRAREQLRSARQSEERIKALTGIEKTLVKKGAGLSSDVLQAKSQLAGAMALRVEAQGDLSIAKNRFQAVFFHLLNNEEVEQIKEIDFPHEKLPLTLENAVETANRQNPELLITLYDTKAAEKDIRIAKSAFYPQLNLFTEAIAKENDAGLIGYDNEVSAGLEFRYNLFNGGSDKAALKAALASQKASAYHSDYVKRIIKEQVSNSWEQLAVQKQRSDLLDQQADIVENFLILAKKERKMGTRSLLDVLNGEINYINATATAIAARQDTKIAAYNLLFAMGEIGLELFEK